MPYVLFEKRQEIAYITINRPERLNAIGAEVREGLIEAVLDFRLDDDLRVAIMTGAGDRAFSSGIDLKEAAERHKEGQQTRRRPEAVSSLFEVVLETYKPIIAAINGYALGAGCELALACDIRLAAEHASIGLVEAKRGLGANFGSVVLPRLIPRNVAMEMMFTGEPIDAHEAWRVGLVNRVAPPSELMPAAERIAEQIVECAPLSVRRMKEMAIKGMEMPMAAALRLNVGPDVYKSEDSVEGARAFVEKRKPQWKGR